MTSITKTLDQVPRGQFIAGEFVTSPATFAVHDPATGQVLAEVGDAQADDARAALDAACGAAARWAATEPRQRAELLHRTFELIVERAETFATLMTLEMGKPLAEARAEVKYGAEFLRWFAEEAVRIDGRWTTAPSGGNRFLVLKQPVGPVLAITPWNFPLAMGTRKIGPALAAGCTVVIKPAALTPLTMLYLMFTLRDAGLPAGVVNCLTTTDAAGVTEPLLADNRLRKLTFTGSTEVGQRLLSQAAGGVLRTSMELGGNAPFVVLSDADLDVAVPAALAAKFRNNGEACTAANRFFVHRSLFDEFVSRFVAAAESLVVGPGMDPEVTLGPLIDQATVQKVTGLVADALNHGARVLTGGAVLNGQFMAPTLLSDVPADARIWHEEIFGPVAPIAATDSDEEAIARANDCEFGLISYLMTRDLSRAIRAAEQLDSGMVALNSGVISNPAAPFGGVKLSGLGREGGPEGIEEYLETKYVGIGL